LEADFSTKEAVGLLGIKFGRLHTWINRGILQADQEDADTGNYKRLSLWALIQARAAWQYVWSFPGQSH